MEKMRKLNKGLDACKILMTVLTVLSVVALLLLSKVAFADSNVNVGDFNEEIFSQILDVWNKIVMPVITAVSTMVLIVAGVFNFLKLKNAMDEAERQKAKSALWWWVLSVVGVVAVLWLTPNLIRIIGEWFPATDTTL